MQTFLPCKCCTQSRISHVSYKFKDFKVIGSTQQFYRMVLCQPQGGVGGYKEEPAQFQPKEQEHVSILPYFSLKEKVLNCVSRIVLVG